MLAVCKTNHDMSGATTRSQISGGKIIQTFIKIKFIPTIFAIKLSTHIEETTHPTSLLSAVLDRHVSYSL